ncbi:MAG: holo-ACP synthase [Cyanobacteria bacterium P01_H01_bin.35]
MEIIIGHGIDIVDINRIEKSRKRSGSDFEVRCFTATERSVTQHDINSNQYFAGRFAAKEAVLKALGTGWSQGIAWTDIEIQRLPTGEPLVVLYGKCQEIANKLGITKWLLSISHTNPFAIASAIAIKTASLEDNNTSQATE